MIEIGRIVAAVVGGAMIGLAASVMLLALGQIAGISGIFAGALPGGPREDRGVRLAFLAGLVGAGFVLAAVRPELFGVEPRIHEAGPGSGSFLGMFDTGRPDPRDLWVMAAAGLLVGIGTWVGGGCTSGHGVCGLSRGSARSLVATVTFMVVAMATVWLRRRLGWP